MDFGDTPEAASEAEGLAQALAQAASTAAEIIVPEHTRRPHAPRKTRNEQLPAHLPRYEVPATVSDEAKTCAIHGEKTLIGFDRLETLEFERPKLKVRVTSTICVTRGDERQKGGRCERVKGGHLGAQKKGPEDFRAG